MTKIELDHQKYLGESLEQIATEKAGIAKPGAPFVVGETRPALLARLRGAGQEAVHRVDPAAELDLRVVPAEARYAGPLRLAGSHQRRNAAVAAAVLEALPARWRPGPWPRPARRPTPGSRRSRAVTSRRSRRSGTADDGTPDQAVRGLMAPASSVLSVSSWVWLSLSSRRSSSVRPSPSCLSWRWLSALSFSIARTEGAGSNFQFAGILTDIGNDVWVISGIKVTVDSNTTLYGDFKVGNPVVVEGVVKEDGTWLATTVNLVTPGGYRFEFAGLVQSLSPWKGSGISFDTTDWSEIDAGITVGDKVHVAGKISADGIWVAETIELLNSEHEPSFTFYGPVVSIDPWNVGCVYLTVDENTTIKGDIMLGEVKVTGWILEDGTWLATEIKHTGLGTGAPPWRT